MSSSNKKRAHRIPHRFRCQYQKGKIEISESIESSTPITNPMMIEVLAKLAIKVKREKGEKLGGIVALQVLKIHEYIMKNFRNDGVGFKKPFYLNKKSKNKEERTERIDIEIYGKINARNSGLCLDKYIELYRKSKGWI